MYIYMYTLALCDSFNVSLRSLRYSTSHLEKLHTNAGKHEVQQHGDQDYVANGLDSHKHTLDHMLLGKREKKHVMSQRETNIEAGIGH